MIIKKGLGLLILVLVFFQVNVFAFHKAVIDVTNASIEELSDALNLGLITSKDLVTLYLERINEYDKNYNAIISINEKALEEAEALDEQRANGNVRSILHGIPIVVKDNIDVLGMPTTGGAKALKDNYPKSNSVVVQKLIDAGAIVLAKTNMSEFAFYASSSKSSYGTVKNAYNTDYSSYGSSGGSAVALAASFAVAALGTDTNASVRLPASANNLVGLRPTVGLVSRTGVLPYDTERDTVGPITKTVSDAVILMNIMNGYDASDNRSLNQDKVTYKLVRKSLDGLTIGIPEKFLKGSNSNGLPENKETYAGVKSLMEQAISELENNGADVVYIDDYYTYETDGWFSNSLSGYTFCDGFNNYLKNTNGTIRSFNQLSASNAKITGIGNYTSDCNSSSDFSNKNALKVKYRNYIEGIMEEAGIDVIAYPSSKNKLLKNSNLVGLQNLSAHASSTINYPAISVPLGFDEGLPYGIEFMAPTGEENLLFEIASIYESLSDNRSNPEIAPALYTIDVEVTKLIENYKQIFTKEKQSSSELEWLDEVKRYLSNYSDNENVIADAEALNLNYLTLRTTSKIIGGAFILVKWIIIVVAIFIVLLLIRKLIRRNLRKKRKHRR